MGFIKKIFKGVKKVVKGIGKVFKKVFKSKIFKFLAIGTAVFLGGGALGLWAMPQTGFMGGLASFGGKVLGAPMQLARTVMGIPPGGQIDPYTRGIMLQSLGSVAKSLAQSAKERKERKRSEEGALAAAEAMTTAENPYIPKGAKPTGPTGEAAAPQAPQAPMPGPGDPSQVQAAPPVPGVQAPPEQGPLAPEVTGVPASIPGQMPGPGDPSQVQGAPRAPGYIGTVQSPEGGELLQKLNVQRHGGRFMTPPTLYRNRYMAQ